MNALTVSYTLCVQKLVSNMVIRARTSLALQQLTDTDVKLYAPSTPAATVADRGQVR
jgi:hypothetical protein